MLKRINALVVALMLSFAPLLAQQHSDHSTTQTQHTTPQAQPQPTQQVQHAPEAAHQPADHAEGHEHAEEDGKFNPSKMIMHHILEAHDWHIVDLPAGTDAAGKKQYTSIALHLPWILYSSKNGFQFFASTHALEEVYFLDHETHKPEPDKDETLIDFSPSKTVVQMFIILLLVTLIFSSVAGSYKKREGKAPKGLQSFMEPVIIFIRDEVVKPNLGKKTDKFLPYMLSLFFFIWFSNVFGLLPFNSNIMGNISITAALAFLSFLLIQFSGTKDYWKHIFAMPGVPKGILIILTPIEFASIFIKPVALMIRLFANISAGHFMVLSLISLIFIMGKEGTSLAGAAGIAPVSILLTLFIFCLETLVTILQAYVFVLLTCTFIGLAMEEHHHEEDHEHAHAH